MIRFLTIVALLTTPAFAQQQPSTATDRVALYYGQCVGNFEKRADEFAALQKQLADAQARIKELEPKTDDKKDDAK